MTSVAVMMSVYNGEKYIPEQLESILAQKDVGIDIYVRDDGSGEAAKHVLKQFAAKHSNIHLDHGENLGISNSFLKMVRDVPDHHDFYAFSDADDVWLPNKLSSAVDVLLRGDSSVAQAYCSQITLVDEQLNFIGHGRPLRRPITFGNSIVECRMSGATAVFNRTLIGIAKPFGYGHAVMHDAWMNVIAAGFGKVHFDPSSYILYRQHGRNADGGVRSSSRRWRDRLGRRELFSRYAMQGSSILGQAQGRLGAVNEELVTRLVKYDDGELSALNFLFDRGVHYQRPLSKILTAFSLARSIK